MTVALRRPWEHVVAIMPRIVGDVVMTARGHPRGKIEDLGEQSAYFGSHGQATVLLAGPRQRTRVLLYRTPVDTVAVGYDLDQMGGILVRAHVRPSGTGYYEQWSTNVLERLRAASSGTGTFNTTPHGPWYGTRSLIR